MGSNVLKPGINDLRTVNPPLAAEWDTERNGGLRPEDVMAGSEKKAWWKCSLGHSWRAAVYSRNSNGRGCPYCTGQKVLRGFNDFETLNPALASEWDHEKNAPVTPRMVTKASSRKFYWVCSLSHSWRDTVSHRHLGRGCPYCAGQKLLAGFNDLSATHPKLAAEWDYEKNGSLTPSDVMAGSEKKVWWKCSEGHSWQAVVYSRKNGAGCPYCTGRKILPGFNDLETLCPEVAAEWDYEKNGKTTPDMIPPSTNRKFHWKCKKGHEWTAGTAERSRGDGCPYCSGKRFLPGEGDLFHARPDLMGEWDWERNEYLDPAKMAPSSSKKVWWLGKCGHRWQAAPKNRIYGNGCPYCSGRMILAGFNDLLSQRPEVAAEWCYERNEGLTPELVHYGSNKYAWFRCRHGHEWHARIADRTYSNSQCPYCAGCIPVQGITDLKTLHPELMREWDWVRNPGIKPENYTEGSHRRVYWKCEKGHTWMAEIYKRVQGGGCPYCFRKKDKHKVFPGVNDLATHAPELAAEWDTQMNGDLRPEDVTPFSNRGIWWKCKNGHRWRTSPNIRARGTGCPYCDGKTPRRMRLI